MTEKLFVTVIMVNHDVHHNPLNVGFNLKSINANV